MPQPLQLAAVVSGGLDSTTLAYHLADKGQLARVVSFNYGQRHVRELEFAAHHAGALGVPWTLIDLRETLKGVLPGNALTDSVTVPVPHGHYAEDTMKATVVPGRNLMMISIAAAHAQALGLQGVAVGVHAGDHFVYPDCRPVFIEHARQTLQASAGELAPGDWVGLMAPFLTITKTDIARMAGDLDVPIDLTWSCYEGRARHCGRCGTCVERIQALNDAGVTDTTVYADPDYWRDAIRAFEAGAR